MAFGFKRMDNRVLHAAEFNENFFRCELFWKKRRVKIYLAASWVM
jgi:hypothetical protein